MFLDKRDSNFDLQASRPSAFEHDRRICLKTKQPIWSMSIRKSTIAVTSARSTLESEWTFFSAFFYRRGDPDSRKKQISSGSGRFEGPFDSEQFDKFRLILANTSRSPFLTESYGSSVNPAYRESCTQPVAGPRVKRCRGKIDARQPALLAARPFLFVYIGTRERSRSLCAAITCYWSSRDTTPRTTRLRSRSLMHISRCVRRTVRGCYDLFRSDACASKFIRYRLAIRSRSCIETHGLWKKFKCR